MKIHILYTGLTSDLKLEAHCNRLLSSTSNYFKQFFELVYFMSKEEICAKINQSQRTETSLKHRKNTFQNTKLMNERQLSTKLVGVPSSQEELS